MVKENTALLLRIYYNPLSAMSRIMDECSLLYAAAAVIVVSVMLQFSTANYLYKTYEAVPHPLLHHAAAFDSEDGEEFERRVPRLPATYRKPLPIMGRIGWWFFSFSPFSILTAIFSLAVLYVPITILAMIIFEPLGSFGVVLRRDYGTLLGCTLLSWTAAHLPVAIAGAVLGRFPPEMSAVIAPMLFALWILAKLYFAFLMVCSLRTVFGASFGNAAGAISCSWISIYLESYLTILGSPFILFLAYSYLHGDIGAIASSFRGRQNFRRHLQATTVNPKDAEANYQLGLIHQQRRQYAEAIERFKKAVEIDSTEIDAHFQLGRIAREQGRLQEAIEHFNAVVTQDDKHAQSEIWREIGATYSAASMHEDAVSALERYIERRQYDPEGLYHLAYSLSKAGRKEEGRATFQRCIEAVTSMPHYNRRGQMRKWRKLAEEQLRQEPYGSQGTGVGDQGA